MAEGWQTLADKVLNDPLGYQSYNKLVQQIRSIAFATHHLGGSRALGVRSASAIEVPEYVDIELDGTKYAGLTVRARVEVRTANAATSVTPKIRNMTAGTDAGTGVSSTGTAADYSGTNQKQSITVTLAAGLNKYRLQVTGGNATNDIFAIGYIEVKNP